jgi:hypothetical protein
MDNKSKFLQIYANLPLNIRTEIVAVVDGEPVSWNSAKIEIENDTPKGAEILKQLVNLRILE